MDGGALPCLKKLPTHFAACRPVTGEDIRSIQMLQQTAGAMPAAVS